ncbi:LytR C-terminal domain-containing protein [Labedella endophytica]|uniref:LytR family transcriptional regulator n=1 Tax=Labedella endophytica TaxID=1523160 RepID=A0A3S0WWD9_9MICO|nr:LytR C-terminal domain-containing protein [Labedella endophytica]RUQ99027.1 LytR family transcriptional regulator [Labedella endophytica]
MTRSHPRDRFDAKSPTEPVRVGAHRAPERRGRGWIAFAWAAAATVVLVIVGIVGLQLITDRLDLDAVFPQQEESQAASPSATAEPSPAVVDPAALVTVLNGTETAGLAADAVEQLAADGWSQNIAVSNADQTDVATTIVYYQDASQEGAARGLAESLGVGAITLSDDFAIDAAEGEEPILQLVVVLGDDYVPPAG